MQALLKKWRADDGEAWQSLAAWLEERVLGLRAFGLGFSGWQGSGHEFWVWGLCEGFDCFVYLNLLPGDGWRMCTYSSGIASFVLTLPR